MAKKPVKKRRITIRSGKAKGKKFQNWIAEQFSNVSGGIPWGQDEDIESRCMGMSGTDIIFRNTAEALFPYSIEAKNCEQFSLPSWISQAKKNKKDDTDWLLFITKNRFDKVVVMDTSLFFDLLKELIELKELREK